MSSESTQSNEKLTTDIPVVKADAPVVDKAIVEDTKPKPKSKAKAKAKAKAKPEISSEKENDSSVPKKDAPEKDAPEKDAPKEETAQDLLSDGLDNVQVRKIKGSKNISSGIVNVLATFNNTKVCFTDLKGNVISWSSSGKCGFRGSRKSTAYAAQVVTQDAGKVAMSHGLKEVIIKLSGPGMGRDSAVRTIQSLGFSVSIIKDVTPVPHNGCRPKKIRRV